VTVNHSLVLATLSLSVLAACGAAPLPPPQPPPSAPIPATPVPPPPVAPAPAAAVEGKWRGVLVDELHLVLTLTRDADGLHGVLDSVDQNATLPIDVLEVDGASVLFEVHQVHGSFQGTVDTAGTHLQGTWTQSQPLPLAFTKDEAKVTTASREPPPNPLDAPVDVEVSQPPAVLRTDGKTHLAYELRVTNFSRRAVTLERIDVAAHGASLAHLEGKELQEACSRPGVTGRTGAERLEVGPGMFAVVYMWITLEAGAVPPSLDHRITLRLADAPDPLTLDSVHVPVRVASPLVISPPLHGGVWKAFNAPSNTSGHRRALIPVGGRARIAQRFAVDWVKVGDDGKTFHGDPSKNESYLAYGSEALAVADGRVTETKDGIPQNVPGDSRALPITLDTVGGNHVIVDLGGGRFAFWAHLQPGSVRVKVGDRVRRGQVLGRVGNSGNSTEPHLHFHVSDASSPLGSEGVPYAFDTFQQRLPDKSLATRKKELPSPDEVVSFP
jgi:Peptidase family M23